MAGTTFRDLVVRIVGDAGQMTSSMAQAGSAVGKFEDRLGKVGSALTAAFAGGAMLNFAKDSVQAALEDQRAQERLQKTLENTVGANDAVKESVEKSIAQMERQYAVADDDLRPAFEQLVRKTKDVTDAQGLLKLALDVSAGSGRSLDDVSGALVKAMGGNVKSLKELGIELKNTSGQTLSTKDIFDQLNAMFNGQAAQAADSQTGRLQAMKIEYDNLKESVGQALLPVLQQLVDMADHLLGWFNRLDGGTQKLITQIVIFGGIGYTAVKVFGAMRVAILEVKAASILTEGAFGALGLSVGSLTGALGLAAAAYVILKQRKDESSQSAKDFKAALEDESTTLEQDVARALSSSTDAMKLMDKAGVSAGDALQFVTDASKGGTDATRELIKKLYGSAEGFVLLKDTLRPMRDAYLENKRQTEDNAAATKSLSDIVWGLRGPMEDAGMSVDEYNQRLNEQIGFQKRAEDAIKKTADAIMQAADEIRAKFDARFAADKAVLDAKNGLKDLANELKKAKDGSLEYKVAVEEQADKTLTAASAVGELAKKQSGLTGAAADAVKNSAMLDYLKDVSFQLDPANPLQRYLAEWITNLNLIPSNISTTVSANWRDSIPQWAKDGFAKGWSVHYQPLPGRAAGGPVSMGSAYLVGEKGPEVFVPAQSGTIVPNGASPSGISVVINTVAGDPLAIERVVLDAIGRASRRGMTALVP